VTTVAVVTPSIPPRSKLLAEALTSVSRQTRLPDAISVAIDHQHEGAAATRNRALAPVDTDWVAFLDDDDLLEPQHIEHLLAHADRTGADLVYPWFTVEGGRDPLGMEGRPFDPAAIRKANYVPITYLVRTELIKGIGGFPGPGWHDDVGLHLQEDVATCEDWAAMIRMVNAGAKVVHFPRRTWVWRHWGGNTGGVIW
jgi:glycosyltransferase involved in cell wall biosynthesis